jgi:hypothetical protein
MVREVTLVTTLLLQQSRFCFQLNHFMSAEFQSLLLLLEYICSSAILPASGQPLPSQMLAEFVSESP